MQFPVASIRRQFQLRQDNVAIRFSFQTKRSNCRAILFMLGLRLRVLHSRFAKVSIPTFVVLLQIGHIFGEITIVIFFRERFVPVRPEPVLVVRPLFAVRIEQAVDRAIAGKAESKHPQIIAFIHFQLGSHLIRIDGYTRLHAFERFRRFSGQIFAKLGLRLVEIGALFFPGAFK